MTLFYVLFSLPGNIANYRMFTWKYILLFTQALNLRQRFLFFFCLFLQSKKKWEYYRNCQVHGPAALIQSRITILYLFKEFFVLLLVHIQSKNPNFIHVIEFTLSRHEAIIFGSNGQVYDGGRFTKSTRPSLKMNWSTDNTESLLLSQPFNFL